VSKCFRGWTWKGINGNGLRRFDSVKVASILIDDVMDSDRALATKPKAPPAPINLNSDFEIQPKLTFSHE